MNPSDTMEQHLNKMGAMVEEIDAIGTIVLVKVKVTMLLMSLPKIYEFLITSLESLESIDPKKLDWEVVATRLLNEMEKNNVGPFESSTKTSFILAQNKLNLRVVGIRQRTYVTTIKARPLG